LLARRLAMLSVAERLRTGVEAEGWSALAPDLSVTVSIGCTMVASGERFESSLHRADAGLYRAKHTGRNRVEVVLPPEPAGTFAGVPPGDRHESSGATSAS
jgi:diguanylate cyclase (GGDEF)-like protein